jgi:hypothetical protein
MLALFLALVVATPTLFAQEWDHMDGRDKDHDPTGAWLIRNSGGTFILTVFHKGGTLTGDTQGESAFIPGAKPPESVIISPESGVWQKTGWRTFAATFITLEYDANPPFALFQFDKIQFTGILNKSGDQIALTALVTLFNPDGTQKGKSFPDDANGVRIPLEILPSTSDALPIPTPPPAPQ